MSRDISSLQQAILPMPMQLPRGFMSTSLPMGPYIRLYLLLRCLLALVARWLPISTGISISCKALWLEEIRTRWPVQVGIATILVMSNGTDWPHYQWDLATSSLLQMGMGASSCWVEQRMRVSICRSAVFIATILCMIVGR